MSNKEMKKNYTEMREQVRLSEQDCGSSQIQVINLTERIKQISEHVKSNHKDYSAQRGLMILLGKRRRFLNYIKKNNKELFEQVTAFTKGH